MNFHLDSTVIINQVLALSAMHGAAMRNSTELRFVLSRDNLPALRPLVRMAFTALYTAFDDIAEGYEAPVGEGETGNDDYTTEDFTLSLSLPLPAGFTAQTATALRRRLEHAVALHTLALVYYDPESPAASRYFADSAEIIGSVHETLSLPGAGTGITPSFF